VYSLSLTTSRATSDEQFGEQFKLLATGMAQQAYQRGVSSQTRYHQVDPALWQPFFDGIRTGIDDFIPSPQAPVPQFKHAPPSQRTNLLQLHVFNFSLANIP